MERNARKLDYVSGREKVEFRNLVFAVLILGSTVLPIKEATAKLICHSGDCKNGYGKGYGTESKMGFEGRWNNNAPWTGWMERPDGTTYYIENGQKYVQTEVAKREREAERRRSTGGSQNGNSSTCEPDFRYKDEGADVGYCGNNGARLQCGYGDTAFPTDYWCYSGGTSHGATLQSAVNKACGCD